MKIEQNISLSKHTYFRLGGPADYFVEVKTKLADVFTTLERRPLVVNTKDD